MSELRMIHVFNEMVVTPGRDCDTAEMHFFNGGLSATFHCVQQAHHAVHAINNHDQLVKENKELREVLFQHYKLCREIVHGYEDASFYEGTKRLLNNQGDS